MTDRHLTDRIPDVVHGRDRWADADLRHLVECGDCATEWRIVQRVAAAATPERVDADRIAAALLDRLRDEPRVLPLRRRANVSRTLLGLAAAASVALAFTLWRPESPADDAAFVPSRQPTMLPELDGLLEAELEVILAMLEPVAEDPIGEPPRLGDLTDQELELLLQEVEG